jgi:hypothetical protein
VTIACLFHAVAVVAVRFAVRRRRNDLSRVESDIVLYTAALVPVFGPVIAWALPRPPQTEEEENAHAVFEKYSEHVRPDIPDYERTLFTGDYEKDLARELDAQSYHEVLRHGSTDQKRNALRRLAELGDPHHFQLIRNCLVDPSHEVRLYAYSELERSSRPFEETIAKSSKALDKKKDPVPALLDLARAYFAYAASGIQDEKMAAFYFRSAERYAADAGAKGCTEAQPARIRALALGRLGEYEEATGVLAALPPDAQAEAETCLVRAEIAFRQRDFRTARAEAERIGDGVEKPRWLSALTGKKR